MKFRTVVAIAFGAVGWCAAAFTAPATSRCHAAPVAAGEKPGQSRPNFVLIIADDQSFGDFGFMGSKVAQTPNLDALASQSACFVNGYVPTSVCRPSLVTLLTGLYPHQHGVFFNHPPPGLSKMKDMTVADWYSHRAAGDHFIRDVASLPRLLAANGYACLQTGKLWEGSYQNAGFTHGMTVNKASAEPAYGNRKVANGWVNHGNGDAGLNIGRDTMEPIYDFVREHKKSPFLVWYAPMLPHAPFDAPSRYRTPYEGRDDVSKHSVGYLAEITRFDDTVGQLVKFINDEGLADNTIFIFVCDNGFQPSTKRNSVTGGEMPDSRSKLSPFENGVRTPLLISWRGQVRPARYDELVQSIDIVPTVLTAASLSSDTKGLPGIDLLPFVTGKATLPERPAFGEIFPNDAERFGDPEAEVDYLWVREGNLKLIQNVRPDNQSGRAEPRFRLYDLSKDPGENNDLAAAANRTDDVKRLEELLRNWWPAGASGHAKGAAHP